MSDFKKLDKIGHQVYSFLTRPIVVKVSCYAAMVTFIVGLGIGLILAQLDPQGFNFVDNFISDLGSYNHTPFPKFLDDTATYTALFLIPLALYMEKQLSGRMEEDKGSVMQERLASYGVLTMFIGLLGLWGIGVFSEDVGGALGPILMGMNWHSIYSVVVFLGMGSAGMFFGIIVVFYTTKLPKLLGVYMIFIPISLAVIYLLTIYKPLEWILLLSLFGYLIPSGLVFIRSINREMGWKEPKEKEELPLKDKLIKYKKGLHDFLTNQRVVSICISLFFIVFSLSLIFGYIVANVCDVQSSMPDGGYNIFSNMISDLGSLRYTPIPKFLDDAAMFSAVIMVPAIFYLKKQICTASQVKEEKLPNKIVKIILSNLGFFFALCAMVGFFGIGFFSEDVSAQTDILGYRILGLSTHYFYSIVVFGSLCICGLFIGAFLIIFPKTVKEKFKVENIPWAAFVIFGLIMMIWPPTHAFLFLRKVAPGPSFHEWFMLFAILAWVFPIFYILRKHAKKEVAPR
jgi:hypothetical membrane protein